ncbi:MAG: DUF3341 domain-containing protein [bacterium]|nr:DUF3341 domain-containing protein [bacterium]
MDLFSPKKGADIILARFKDPASLLHAAEKVRETGYSKFDCHSPFPIHGMDQAMGLKRSPVGYVVGCMGATGLVSAMVFMWWTSAVDYPLVISGKPFFSWQAYIPVAFAITILLSAFGAVLGMLGFNKLPRLHHPLFNSEQFSAVSDNGFFVSIEGEDKKYDEAQTSKFLESIGGTNIEVIKDL